MLETAQAKVEGAVRKAVAALTGFLLALVLLTALLITGFYLLVQAAILALTPIIGEAAAMATVGGLCMLLLVAFFWRLTRTPSPSRSGAGSASGQASALDNIRDLIRRNPFESVLTAFAVGLAQQGDPRLRSLLMKGGMELMKEAEAEQRDQPDSDTSSAEDAAAAEDNQASGSTRR